MRHYPAFYGKFEDFVCARFQDEVAGENSFVILQRSSYRTEVCILYTMFHPSISPSLANNTLCRS